MPERIEGADDVGGLDDVRGVEAHEPSLADATVPRRVFLTVGAMVSILAIVYWFTAYEDAGTVMLALAAVLSLWYGTFLWLQGRRRTALGVPDSVPLAAIDYLPHASIWPLAIGSGVALIANGLVLGIWVVVPGIGLTLLGTAGFIRQSRRRD